MKMILLFSSLLSIFSIFTFGQTEANYSGEWILDKEKSDLGGFLKELTSMKMRVEQTKNEITVTTTTEFLPFPKPVESPKPKESGKNETSFSIYNIHRGYVGDGTFKYSLDGKETTIEVEEFSGKLSVKVRAFFENSLLKLETTRTFSGKDKEITLKAIETWTLADNEKTLKITRETEFINPEKQKIEMVFTKN